MSLKNNWPKQLPELTLEQQKAREQWMKIWHDEYLTHKYSVVDEFNHKFVAQFKIHPPCRTLEIGAGLGEHIKYEDLSKQEYHCLEYRNEFVETIQTRFPTVKVICGDIHQKQNFSDGYFNRIIAIHVLEHLPNLPKALEEINRLLANDGWFDIVLPTEGGLAYHFAREMTSARLFKKKFGFSYKTIMQVEHINTFPEILKLLKEMNWQIEKISYFPFAIPYWHLNFCIGIRLRKKLHKKLHYETAAAEGGKRRERD